ncbi:FAD-dependent oxidoreductase [Tamilnaduibacter salinus]|nr:FAD-dependent oxidoreductase [Tamilnaduibacter salinus]
MAGLTAGLMLRDRGVAVTVFEKSRGPGGRLASKRVDGGSLDIGAQYFTVRDPGFRAFLDHHTGPGQYGAWQARLSYERPDGHWESFHEAERWVGMPRMTAISRALSQGLDCCFETRIHSIVRRKDGAWCLIGPDGEQQGDFDAVLVTAPPEQARGLLSESNLWLADDPVFHERPLAPCWAVGVHFPVPTGLGMDGMSTQHHALQWAANNSSKPDRDEAGEWWVLHGRAEWSEANRASDPDTVIETLLEAFTEKTGFRGVPDEVLAHRWLYARETARDDGPLYKWFDDHGIGVCGDWLSSGRVEGAWASASALVDRILKTATNG